MKTIAGKLALSLSLALLALSVAVGLTFSALFRQYTVKKAREDLSQKADLILSALSADASGGPPMGPGARGRAGDAAGSAGRMAWYSRYLDALSEQADTDAWLVDEELQLITGNMRSLTYGDLPPGAEEVVREVFRGETVFSSGFGALTGEPSLTAGVPVYTAGQVTGALLLHAPLEGLNEAQREGVRILLISIGAGLALSILLSLLTGRMTTGPLKRIRRASLLIAGGDYAARSGVRRGDEIGELAEAIDTLGERLDEAQREHETTEKLRREFMANVSHELKTPVTVIRGSLEALSDEVVTSPQEVKEYYRQMLSETSVLERLISDQLDLSKLQNPDFQMEMQDNNLCDVLSDAVRSARQLAQAKEIALFLRLDREHFPFRGDYSRLRQMFMIVLNNAVKYSFRGGEIDVTLQGSAVTVRDRGIGISPEDQAHLFERFFRVSAHGNAEGSGLGLAIARQIARRHRVDISLSSAPGEGTEVRFVFPQGSAPS